MSDLAIVCLHVYSVLQPEEEALLPQAGTEGYQFDPHTQIPSEGFQF